jgi:uncharacterized protein YecE (DUF72 family)
MPQVQVGATGIDEEENDDDDDESMKWWAHRIQHYGFHTEKPYLTSNCNFLAIQALNIR